MFLSLQSIRVVLHDSQLKNNAYVSYTGPQCPQLSVLLSEKRWINPPPINLLKKPINFHPGNYSEIVLSIKNILRILSWSL